MSLFARLTDWVVARVGLDFDIDFDDPPFHAITDSLVLGARPRPDQVSLLTGLGVTHVVSCLPASERADMTFLAPLFETLFLPVHDGMHQDITAHFTEVLDFVERAGPTAVVLVHCQVGVSRSATLVIAQLMTRDSLRFYEAYQRVQSRRPQILPNIGFASQLQHHEHRLFPGDSSRPHASLTRYLHERCNVPVAVEELQRALEDNDFDAVRAIRDLFGDEIPRVIQGARV
jgi:protein-tyrosine phosphatase